MVHEDGKPSRPPAATGPVAVRSRSMLWGGGGGSAVGAHGIEGVRLLYAITSQLLEFPIAFRLVLKFLTSIQLSPATFVI